jgi:hypothetical protein
MSLSHGLKLLNPEPILISDLLAEFACKLKKTTPRPKSP